MNVVLIFYSDLPLYMTVAAIYNIYFWTNKNCQLKPQIFHISYSSCLLLWNAYDVQTNSNTFME